MPFFCTYNQMNSDKNNNKRPYRMINVSFPPAKYGVIVAIVIIIVCSILLFI